MVKKVMNTGSRRPWFTHEFDLLNEEKVRRCRRYDKTRRRSDWNRFTAARDRAQDAIEGAKLLFYHERLKDLQDPKQMRYGKSSKTSLMLYLLQTTWKG